AMFLRDPGRNPAQEAPGGVRWPIVAATVVAVAFGVYPAPLLDTAKAAATLMLESGARSSRYVTRGPSERTTSAPIESPATDRTAEAPARAPAPSGGPTSPTPPAAKAAPQ